MSYSNNPLLPKARRLAVTLVLKEGLSVAVAARRCGIHRSTLHRWLRKAKDLHGSSNIPTGSSRPRSCPWALGGDVVARVIELRRQTGRCGAVIREMLAREGMVISVSSVNNILSRAGRLNSWYGRQGRPKRPRVPRPEVSARRSGRSRHHSFAGQDRGPDPPPLRLHLDRHQNEVGACGGIRRSRHGRLDLFYRAGPGALPSAFQNDPDRQRKRVRFRLRAVLK